MNILFSVGQYPTQEHPFAAFIAAMAEELAARGHKVTVIAPQSLTHCFIRGCKIFSEKEVFNSDNYCYPIEVYRPMAFTFGDGKIRGRLTCKGLQMCCNCFLNKLGAEFDIAYCHFWQSAYQILPYVMREKIPMVVVTGEDEIKINRILTPPEKNKLRSYPSRIIGVSTKNIRESVDKKLADESKCTVIVNGPDLRSFKTINKNEARGQLGLDNKDFVVAFVGRFIHRKGALRVEQAIEKIGDPHVKSIFIGSTMKDEDRRQEPMGRDIIFKGIVEHDRIPVYLCASDVYILPTLAEGCSNSIVEAMACGLPIISSDKDFNYDILDSSNAILVDPLNIDQISEAIIKIKEDAQLRQRMSQNSLKKAQSLSFEKRVDKIIQILHNIQR